MYCCDISSGQWNNLKYIIYEIILTLFVLFLFYSLFVISSPSVAPNAWINKSISIPFEIVVAILFLSIQTRRWRFITFIFIARR